MIILNETNPNGSCQLNINKKLLSSVVTLFVFINTFRYSTIFLVTIVLIAMVELSETRGRSGGFRSFRTSRTRSSSGGSSSKPKITKYTTITATSARSPVIVSQTKPGSRLGTFMKVVFAHTMHR
ncbi:hypothetical protein pdam_00009720 [Pocillopora damicornis]|uniref:Uncharacterized protein n=1 Tax=Pocillopora damicornis TaxID=46731 RepID=A0A3M6TP58_POCDA|nr:hypothetical protein pdam_00009720 [Pocillopora damicornis]